MRMLSLLLLVGCMEPAPPYDLDVTSRVYTGERDIHVRLVDSTGTEVIHHEWFRFERAFTYGVLEPDRRYKLDLFLDLNGDTRCDTSEPLWRIDILDTAGPVAIDLDTAGRAVDGCAVFGPN